jgi:hypothetical protein
VTDVSASNSSGLPIWHRYLTLKGASKNSIAKSQSLHNLSDEQTGYLIRDRMSFMRFLDLELEDPVPDATTIWLFREALAQAGLIDRLFERLGQHLAAEGYIARGGQIIDATIVSVPKQRNTKEKVQDRDDEPRLQHPGWSSSSGWQPGPLECAHGWGLCGIVQRTAPSPAKGLNGPRSGAHPPRHARGNRSLSQGSNCRKPVLFDHPARRPVMLPHR